MALFTSSADAKEILESLRRASGGVRPNLWARAAFGYSLSLVADPDMKSYDSEGQEYSEKMFFGQDEESLMALLRQRLRSYQKLDATSRSPLSWNEWRNPRRRLMAVTYLSQHRLSSVLNDCFIAIAAVQISAAGYS